MFVPVWLLITIIVICSLGSASSRPSSDDLKVEIRRDCRTDEERAADAQKARVAFWDQVVFWGLLVAAVYVYFHH